MNVDWLMAVAVGACNSCVAVAAKGAEHARCRAAPFLVTVFAVAGITAWFTTLGGEVNWADWQLWLFGIVMGAFYVGANVVMLRANGCWPPSIVWAAANMAFVIPITLSAAFLGEPLRWVDAAIFAGVAIMLAGLVEPAAAVAGGDEKPRESAAGRWLVLGLVFATNGALMMLYKLFGVMLPGRSPSALVTIIYAAGCLISLTMLLAAGGPLRFGRAEILLGLGGGAANALAGLAMLRAMRLPAAAAFPVVQGSSLTGGVLLCAAVFRERLTPRKIGALLAGLAAMALTILR
jgi:hypothetical protein